jgi:hypothetical protein
MLDAGCALGNHDEGIAIFSDERRPPARFSFE